MSGTWECALECALCNLRWFLRKLKNSGGKDGEKRKLSKHSCANLSL